MRLYGLRATTIALMLTASVGYAADLQQCVDIALRQNPDIKASEAQIEQAQAALTQAKGGRWPKLTASLTGTRTNDALNAFGLKLEQRGATFNDFGAGQFTGPSALGVAPSNLNYPGTVTNYNTRLELQIPLYNGGMISGYIDQAHSFVKAAQSGDRAARQQVVFRVVQAYQGVHAAQSYVKVAEQAVATAEAYVRTTRNLMNQGLVVRSDLLFAEVNLSDMKVKLEEAKRAEAAAMDQLHLLLGMSLEEPLEVGPDYMPGPVQGSIVQLQNDAVAGNPGINALRSQIAAAREGVNVARADLYPHFNAVVRQDWNAPTLQQSAPSYTLAGVLSWQVLDFGVIKGAVGRAEAARMELEARLKAAEDGVRFQVADAWRGAQEAESRVNARTDAVVQAEEAERLVAKRYANGVTTMVEVMAAETQLDKARADLVAARYQLTVQRSALLLAVGRLDGGQL